MAYLTSAGWLSFMLITYPIAWACAEGSNIITVTSEMIWYGILDVLAGPVFLFLFLFELRNVDYKAFGLHSGKYTDHGDVARVEKGPMPTTTAPATTAPNAAPPAPAPETITQ